jgi:hypothetical protein
MSSETSKKPRQNRVGIYAAASYAFAVVGVFAYTLYNTQPEYIGYDWIPLLMLAMPWSRFGASPVLGVILNAGLLYLLGVLFEKLRRQNASWG